MKAVLALGEIDFKRHKDVMGYFNKTFVAEEVFPREFGRGLARLQQKREKSDYDDFYVASRDEAEEQFEAFREHFRISCPNCANRASCMGGCPICPEIVLCEEKKEQSAS